MPRNKLLGLGIGSLVTCLVLVAALEASFIGTDNIAGLQAAVAFIFLFPVFYGIFVDGPSYFYIGEIFPSHLRAKGITISVIVQSMTGIFWQQLTPTAFANIGWKFYLCFICISAAGGIVIWFTFPNTLDKSLEEIGQLFGDEYMNNVEERGESDLKAQNVISVEEAEKV